MWTRLLNEQSAKPFPRAWIGGQSSSEPTAGHAERAAIRHPASRSSFLWSTSKVKIIGKQNGKTRTQPLVTYVY
jgi:hypothetical protein